MIRTQIPRFRLPEEVIDEETGYVLGLGVEFRAGVRIDSMKQLLAEGYDAVFVGSGAPRGRDLDVPGRQEAGAKIHVGIDWLSSVSFGHVTSVGRRVIVLGGGNTAMDCCRTARRLGGDDVKVIVRSGFDEMKASPWEKEDAMHEGIPILNFLVPKAFLHDGGRLTGMTFEKVKAVFDERGRRSLVPTGEPDQQFDCDEVLVAVGQENAFPWIERDCGVEFDRSGMPVLDKTTLQATRRNVFFGGDAALGPKNIIWAVAQGHDAAISIDKLLNGEDVHERPAPGVTLVSQKMGIHEWSYDNEVAPDTRFKVPWRDVNQSLRNIKVEVELGFDVQTAWKEAQRCLNCDVQTVFFAQQCIECDACVDVCPTDCITFTPDGDEPELRRRLRRPALNAEQPLYLASGLKTGRVMVKDEDVCLHCGLCAERCPTGAWDMQKFLLERDPRRTRLPDASEGGRLMDTRTVTPGSTGAGARRPARICAVNDFVIKFANVNGSGSASANELFARSILRMGVPVSPRNIFPSNIQGLPTWYEVRVTEAGYLGRRGGVDLMVAMNPQTWDHDLKEMETGGYLHVRLDSADGRVEVPR